MAGYKGQFKMIVRGEKEAYQSIGVAWAESQRLLVVFTCSLMLFEISRSITSSHVVGWNIRVVLDRTAELQFCLVELSFVEEIHTKLVVNECDA